MKRGAKQPGRTSWFAAVMAFAETVQAIGQQTHEVNVNSCPARGTPDFANTRTEHKLAAPAGKRKSPARIHPAAAWGILLIIIAIIL